MKKSFRVKLLTRGSLEDGKSDFERQFPKNEATWDKCSFLFDPFEKNYDWLVIVDDLPRIFPTKLEVLQCPKENTILVTSEPSSITFYGRAFAKQFHYIITNHNEKLLPHPNAIRSQTGNVWFYGKSYDEIINVIHPFKTKKISTVCSDKRQGHTMHKARYDFTKIMEESIPELERFGKGFQWIETKAEALDDFQFHVVIENHIEENVWTEKLADAFLGFTVPIYCGCPNVYQYFPKDSLIQIDIKDINGSIQKIKEVIAIEGEYERRLDSVKEARRRVIEEYNLPAMIHNIIENAEEKKVVENKKIYSRRVMRLRYLPDLFRLAYFRISSFIKRVI